MITAQIYNQLKKNARAVWRRATGNFPSEKIFFLHIPKCGGTSADAAITEAFGYKQCLHLDSAASRKAAAFQNTDLMEYRNALLPYFMEQTGLRYISGHFVFDSELHSRYGSQWQYITLLRDPVQKYLSQYFYNLQKQNKDHFGIEESVESFIESPEGIRLGQDITQKITGNAEVTREGSAVRKDRVEQAIRNIEEFHLVGILEDLERFESDFKKKFGTSLRISKMNRNREKDERIISPTIRKKIEQHCQPDIALYEHVKKMLYG